MNFLFADVVFGAVDAIEAYRGGLYESSDGGTTRKVVLGALIVAGIWFALYAFDRVNKQRKKAQAASDRSLFGDLCTSHRLTLHERTALEAMAALQPGTPTEAIFIHPEQFDAAHSSKLDAEAKAQLRHKIFGDLAVA